MFETVVVGADRSPTGAEAVRQVGGKLHIAIAYKPRLLTSPEAEVDRYLKSLGSATWPIPG